MKHFLIMLSGFLLLTGCATTDGLQRLETQNQTLQQQLDTANQKIQGLQTKQNELQADLDESQRVNVVLDKEKSSRIKESATLRSQLRTFAQQQIDANKAFLVNSNLLDYVGGELVKRAKYDNRPLMLVDIDNAMPKSGVLTGVGGYFVKPTVMKVQVLRRVNERLVVIWESRPLLINQTGLVKKNFPVTVGVEKGDIIGYYFPKQATVSFDTGTADTRYTKEVLRLGNSIKLSSLSGSSEKRAYSLGIYAILK